MALAEHLDISFMIPAEEASRTAPARRSRSVSADKTFAKPGTTASSMYVDTGREMPSKVRFFVFCETILIPSRVEYKQACCDLWWSREDFLGFQDSAVTEIRAMCQAEQVSVREARRRLYQPQQEHARRVSGEKTRAVEVQKKQEQQKVEVQEEGEVGGEELHHSWSSFSLHSLADEDEETEEDVFELFSVHSDEEEDEDEEAHSRDSTPPSSPGARLFKWPVFQSAQNLSDLPGESFSEDADNEACLSLCAALSPSASLQLCLRLPPRQVLLRWEEPLVPSPSSSQPERTFKKRRDARDEAWLGVMGVCSFALPVLGYILLQSKYLPTLG